MENTAHIEFISTCNTENLKWPGDEQLLKQVLVNLLRNSVQALENQENAKIEIKALLNASSKLEICVKDNGPGIAPDIIDHIFVPFFTTRTNGSGIGLSLSRQIMRLHGGSLLVSSIPEKETVLCMRFQG
jgi:signal transduction histidine kinase